MHPAQQPIDQLLKDCEIRRQRRSGPGGQHRNKVETGIFIKHLPTDIEAAATEKRSQEANRQQAVFRLRVCLAIQHRCTVRESVEETDDGAEAYSRSELWQRRFPKGRIAINPQHEDFPAVLAEAIDVIAHHDWEMPRAAESLQCSASQLVKLLRLEPAALNFVNQSRVAIDKRPLK